MQVAKQVRRQTGTSGRLTIARCWGSAGMDCKTWRGRVSFVLSRRSCREYQTHQLSVICTKTVALPMQAGVE